MNSKSIDWFVVIFSFVLMERSIKYARKPAFFEKLCENITNLGLSEEDKLNVIALAASALSASPKYRWTLCQKAIDFLGVILAQHKPSFAAALAKAEKGI
jgi:hypothetical protein